MEPNFPFKSTFVGPQVCLLLIRRWQVLPPGGGEERGPWSEVEDHGQVGHLRIPTSSQEPSK